MALDKEAGNTLFGNIKKSAAKEEAVDISPESKEVVSAEIQSKAKWHEFDKVTALLTTEQKEGLDRVARKLMKHRSKFLKNKSDSERITANTIIRALIDNFLKFEDSMVIDVFSSEEEVRSWIANLMNK
jgi:Zn-dependent oligopeptidase